MRPPKPTVEALVRDNIHGFVAQLQDAWPAAGVSIDEIGLASGHQLEISARRRQVPEKAVRLALLMRASAVGTLMGHRGKGKTPTTLGHTPVTPTKHHSSDQA